MAKIPYVIMKNSFTSNVYILFAINEPMKSNTFKFQSQSFYHFFTNYFSLQWPYLKLHSIQVFDQSTFGLLFSFSYLSNNAFLFEYTHMHDFHQICHSLNPIPCERDYHWWIWSLILNFIFKKNKFQIHVKSSMVQRDMNEFITFCMNVFVPLFN